MPYACLTRIRVWINYNCIIIVYGRIVKIFGGVHVRILGCDGEIYGSVVSKIATKVSHDQISHLDSYHINCTGWLCFDSKKIAWSLEGWHLVRL